MAINGISLKNKTTKCGHDGSCYKGDLYIGKTKIAHWEQDEWCGPDHINMEKGFSLEKLNNLIKQLNKNKAIHGTDRNGESFVIEYTLEFLVCDLLDGKRPKGATISLEDIRE